MLRSQSLMRCSRSGARLLPNILCCGALYPPRFQDVIAPCKVARPGATQARPSERSACWGPFFDLANTSSRLCSDAKVEGVVVSWRFSGKQQTCPTHPGFVQAICCFQPFGIRCCLRQTVKCIGIRVHQIQITRSQINCDGAKVSMAHKFNKTTSKGLQNNSDTEPCLKRLAEICTSSRVWCLQLSCASFGPLTAVCTASASSQPDLLGVFYYPPCHEEVQNVMQPA